MPSMEIPTQQQPMAVTEEVIITEQPALQAQPEMVAEEPSMRGGFFEECGCCGCQESCGCC